MLCRCATVAAFLVLAGCGLLGPDSGTLDVAAPAADGKAVAGVLVVNEGDRRYSWMSVYLPWRESGGLSVLRQFHTKPSEEPAIHLSQARRYTLYCTLGSNYERVYAVLRVESNGAAVAAYQEYPSRQCFQKSFRLAPQQIQMLTRCLEENGIGNLAESYVDTKTEEGAQGGVTLHADRQVRRTYLSNAWPKPVQNLFEQLSDTLLRFTPQGDGNGFVPVTKSILQTDPETTLGARGLVRDGK